MPKQQIDIDVPEGKELKITQFVMPDENLIGTIEFDFIDRQKEPEFIEIREYLCRLVDGRIVAASATKGFGTIEQVEANPYFFRWIDQDWRKVEV